LFIFFALVFFIFLFLFLYFRLVFTKTKIKNIVMFLHKDFRVECKIAKDFRHRQNRLRSKVEGGVMVCTIASRTALVYTYVGEMKISSSINFNLFRSNIPYTELIKVKAPPISLVYLTVMTLELRANYRLLVIECKYSKKGPSKRGLKNIDTRFANICNLKNLLHDCFNKKD
jgi:hypothetical protein